MPDRRHPAVAAPEAPGASVSHSAHPAASVSAHPAASVSSATPAAAEAMGEGRGTGESQRQGDTE